MNTIIEQLRNMNGFQLEEIKQLIDNEYNQLAVKDDNYMLHNFIDDFIYIVYYADGSYHYFCKGRDAYIEYKNWGVKLGRKTKDLFPTYEMLLDKETECLTRNNTMLITRNQTVSELSYF